MTKFSTQEERDEFFRELREAIDFLEAHPEMPAPYFSIVCYWWDPPKDQLSRVARDLKPFRKSFTDHTVQVRKSYRRGNLDLLLSRSGICERVEIGKRKRIVEVPTSVKKEVIEEPVYEYRCPALLDNIED